MDVKLDALLLEEHRLRVFKNRVLRNIFGPKREEVKREWRRLSNEEFYDVCSSPKSFGDQTKNSEMCGACVT
jgi:hypothetical protein